MTTLKAFLVRHPVATYFALTFAISWGGILFVIGGLGGIPGTTAQHDPLFPLVFLAMLAGPSVSGILLTGLVHGRAGLREFVSRLLKGRVSARWYAIALLTAPLLSMTVAAFLALSFRASEFLPAIFVTHDKTALLLFGLAVGLGAGAFEELGWTGFAIPEMRRRFGVLTTGLMVGMLWGAWHWLAVIWGIGDRAGTIPLVAFVLLDTLSFLVAFRVLMVWIYERTGSLLLAMLMHASLTASALIFAPVTTGAPLLIYDLVLAAALWVVIAAIAVTHGAQLSRHSVRRQMAG
jgi:membrane protease YdiL (CAAX protease family)